MINKDIKQRINLLRSGKEVVNDYFGIIAKIAHSYGKGDLLQAKEFSKLLLKFDRCEYGNHWLIKANPNYKIEYTKESRLFYFDKIRLGINDNYIINEFIRFKNTFINYNNIEPYHDKKVAVCIAGQVRGLEGAIDSINDKIIKPLNADVFVTVWDTIGGNPERYLENVFKIFPSLNKNKLSGFYELNDLIEKKLGVNEGYINSNLNKIDNKINVEILSENKFDKEQKANIDAKQLNQIKLYYTMNKCVNNVVEYENSQNFHYDYIIKLRPDKIIHDEVNISSVKQKELQFNNNDFFGPGDQTIIGRRDDMVMALNFYKYFSENKENYRSIFNSEYKIDEHKNFGEYLWALGFCFKRYSKNCNGKLLNFELEKEEIYALPLLAFIEPIIKLEEKITLIDKIAMSHIKNDIDIIRDTSILLERYDLRLSYELMKLAHEMRPNGKFIKNRLDLYRNKLFNSSLKSARALMNLKKWDEAADAFSKIREEFPEREAGFIEGGMALNNLQRVDDAVRIWKLCDARRAKYLIMEVLERIESVELYEESLEYLLEEVCDFKMPTIMTEMIHRLWIHGDRALACKYIDIIKSKSNVDYYTKISMGLVQNPNIEYLRKVFSTKKLYLISRIASTAPFHQVNMKVIKENNIHLLLENCILKKSYLNIFDKGNYHNKKPDVFYKGSYHNKRLKIAVCVSGQLRGYEKSFLTWEKFGFKNHNVDIFCSVWDNVGRKKIEKIHISRLFNKNFSELFIKVTESKSKDVMLNMFPNLFSYFEKPKYVTGEKIKKFYSAKKVNIIKESDHLDKTNAYKMYYMIQKCYELIDDPEKYDLIIRIRPDKLIEDFDTSWGKIISNLSDKNLYTDLESEIRPGGLFVGDQFAIAKPQPMQVYAKTFEKVLNNEGVFSEKDFSGFTPHKSLCLSLLEKSIFTMALPLGVKLGGLVDDERIPIDILIDIIKKDLVGYPELLVKFLQAIEKDKQEELNYSPIPDMVFERSDPRSIF